MERLAQYLDDLEDLYYAVALLMEKIRRGLQTCAVIAASLVVQIGCIMLALSQPPLALAVVCLTIVGLLYRGATAVTGHYSAAS